MEFRTIYFFKQLTDKNRHTGEGASKDNTEASSYNYYYLHFPVADHLQYVLNRD